MLLPGSKVRAARKPGLKGDQWMEDVPQPSTANEDEWMGVGRNGEENSVWDARGNLLVYVYRRLSLQS